MKLKNETEILNLDCFNNMGVRPPFKFLGYLFTEKYDRIYL